MIYISERLLNTSIERERAARESVLNGSNLLCSPTCVHHEDTGFHVWLGVPRIQQTTQPRVWEARWEQARIGDVAITMRPVEICVDDRATGHELAHNIAQIALFTKDAVYARFPGAPYDVHVRERVRCTEHRVFIRVPLSRNTTGRVVLRPDNRAEYHTAREVRSLAPMQAGRAYPGIGMILHDANDIARMYTVRFAGATNEFFYKYYLCESATTTTVLVRTTVAGARPEDVACAVAAGILDADPQLTYAWRTGTAPELARLNDMRDAGIIRIHEERA